MGQSLSIDATIQKSVLSFLQQQVAGDENIDIAITSVLRNGIIQKRNGVVVSAQTNDLSGNGAFMALASIEGAQINVTPAAAPVQKSVSLNLTQAQRVLARQNLSAPPLAFSEEAALLEQAKLHFFQFKIKEASSKLISILRSNRFYYPAWLWQSRLITRHDHLRKALDEALRWGNHDQEIWRESRKIQPHLFAGDAEIKRCFFCWCPLTKGAQCPHCHAFLTITSQPQSPLLRKEGVRCTMEMFEKALKSSPGNNRIAYSMAVGWFNLKDYRKALEFMRLAQKLSPKTVFYQKCVSLLAAIAKTQIPQAVVKSPPSASPVKGIPADKGRQTATAKIPPAVAKPGRVSGGAAPSPSVPATPPKYLQTENQPRPSTAGSAGQNAKKTIFVVEDSPTSRKVLKMILERNGFSVQEAASGREALDLAESIKPSMILLDIMLPDMTGYDILPKIKEMKHLHDVPVIMLTGKKKPTDRMKGMLLGSNEYLTKPFNPDKLLSLIGNYV